LARNIILHARYADGGEHATDRRRMRQRAVRITVLVTGAGRPSPPRRCEEKGNSVTVAKQEHALHGRPQDRERDLVRLRLRFLRLRTMPIIRSRTLFAGFTLIAHDDPFERTSVPRTV